MSEKKEEQKKLNPQIMDVEVGIRELRKITIYPLSMGDQLELTEIVSQALSAQLAREDAGDIMFVAFIVDLLKDNLGKILDMVSDEDGNELLKEMSNMQAAEIAEAIYDVNFGTVAKNFKSLFGKLSKLFLSERPSPPSVKDTDTGSKTSTKSTTTKEASASDS